MSQSKKQSIENAGQVIEKFGGIRPMASKINVAVTTVQGWKKRDVIPGTRRELVLSVAEKEGIDLSDVIEGLEKPEDVVEVVTQADKVKIEEQNNDQDSKDVIELRVGKDYESEKPKNDYTEIVVEGKQANKSNQSVWVGASIIFVMFIAVVMTAMPSMKGKDSIDLSEEEVAPSGFKGLVPGDWSEELAVLQEKVEQTKVAAQETMDSVQAMSQDFIEENGLEERVEQLQTYVSEIAGENGVYSLLSRFDTMRESEEGEETLEQAVGDLLVAFEVKDAQNADEEQVLAESVSRSHALGKTFENVPKNELKAAALLFAMTQVRSSLNRPDEAFDEDLELLKNMVGDEDPNLWNSLDKLAPHSKKGIYSVGGLRQEFQNVAGEVVVASLRGEEVSLSEKMSAKMNDILQVEKDGELVTGTETQAKLNKANKMIEKDRWEEALRFLRKHLRAEELKPLRPWINEVEAFLTAQKVQRAIEKAIAFDLGEGYLGGSKLLDEAEKQ